MRESHPERARGRARKALAFAAGVALAIAAGLALRDRLPVGPRDAAAPPDPSATAEPAPDAPAPVVRSSSPERPLAPSATLELARADFPASGAVRVHLGLAEPSADDEPRRVWIVSITDHRRIETHGRLDAARSVAAIELDPEWLLPGSYLVEMRTTERSHMPLRRYAIVVR